jgi:hypothetical protein
MAFDFPLEQALYQFGEAALLSISQGLSGFFDFGVQCYVGFFSHVETDTIDFKIRAILFFQMGCILHGLPPAGIVTC